MKEKKAKVIDATAKIGDQRKSERGFTFGQEVILTMIPTLGSIAAAGITLAAAISNLEASKNNILTDMKKFRKN